MSIEIIAYTDGSCDINPGGNGGWAVVLFDNGCSTRMSGYVPTTKKIPVTNQRMEMYAVIKALSSQIKPSKFTIFTDSSYVCNAYNKKWVTNWKKNGWKTADGKDVANKDLWLHLDKLWEYHTVEIFHVKGHSVNFFNNECDKMAKNAIKFMATAQKILFETEEK